MDDSSSIMKVFTLHNPRRDQKAQGETSTIVRLRQQLFWTLKIHDIESQSQRRIKKFKMQWPWPPVICLKVSPDFVVLFILTFCF